MSILTTIELDIEGELKKAWGIAVGVEQTVVQDAGVLWGDAKGILVTILPEEYVILKALWTRVSGDITTFNVPDMETAALNAATAEEQLLITKLGSPLFQAALGMWKALGL